MTRALALLLVTGCGLVGCGEAGHDTPDAAPDAPRCADDAQCDDGLFCTGEERCAPSSASADARGCVSLGSPCGALRTCTEETDACETDCGATRDADGDGARALECGGEDCDDGNADVHPGAIEVCDRDALDEDCDPGTFGERDADADGAIDRACCNGTGTSATCGTDCDDARAGVHPGEAEECDGLDQDCDGAIDETVTATFVRDADGDARGSSDPAAETATGCAPPDGFASSADDCDDTEGAIHPGAYDRCDGAIDDDCSGTADDPPGGCACGDGETRTCPLPGLCGDSTQACTSGIWGACGRAPQDEICGNDLDEDCDGAADDGCTCAVTFRACGIDEGACTRGIQRCLAGGSWSACDGSVDPSPEICNAIDDDCDAATDEGLTRACWDDPDGDGFAWVTAARSEHCGACPAGTTARDPSGAGAADCDGDDARAYPGQTASFSTPRSSAGGYDFDCDGTITPDNSPPCTTDAAGTGCASSRAWYGAPSQCGARIGWSDCVYMGPVDGCQPITGCTPGIGSDCMRLSCR